MEQQKRNSALRAIIFNTRHKYINSGTKTLPQVIHRVDTNAIEMSYFWPKTLTTHTHRHTHIHTYIRRFSTAILCLFPTANVCNPPLSAITIHSYLIPDSLYPFPPVLFSREGRHKHIEYKIDESNLIHFRPNAIYILPLPQKYGSKIILFNKFLFTFFINLSKYWTFNSLFFL